MAPFLLFLAIYLPRAGHGFIRDDSAWILTSRIRSVQDFLHLFHTDNGFYRPVVALTFAVNEWMFGSHPLGYGLSNVFLALLCSLSIASLARAFGLPRGAAMFAGALWLLNFHGIGMAVLWVSGRTSLLATLAATMSAAALLRGRGLVAGVWLLTALLAKEETVLLPAILFAWLLILRDADRRGSTTPLMWIALASLAELTYFALRASTHAMTLLTAVSSYHFTVGISAVAKNLVQYADRNVTFSAAVLLLAFVFLGRARPWLDQRTRAIVVCGGIWLAGTAAPTVLLPVRSDLYACLPSVGVCLAATALCTRLWEQASATRQRRGLVAALVLLALLSPWYYLRTNRWVELAEFSSTTLADLGSLTKSLPDHANVVIDDDRGPRANMASVFGTLLDDAYALSTGRRLSFWIEPALDDAARAGFRAPCATCASLRLRVSSGHLYRQMPGDQAP